MALSDSLVAYYSLEDTAGTDATGRGNTLTAVNSPTAVTGKVANGVQYVAASTQYQTIADNADLSMGDIDFTVAGWTNLTNISGNKSLWGKWHSSGGVGSPREYWIGAINATLGFYVSNDATTQINVNWSASLVAATWYFIVTWHDSVANTINISVNDGTVVSASHTTGVYDGISAFRLGSMASTNNNHSGIDDEVGVWKRVLTAAEITDLYNAGSGRDYAYISAAAGQPTMRRWGGVPGLPSGTGRGSW